MRVIKLHNQYGLIQSFSWGWREIFQSRAVGILLQETHMNTKKQPRPFIDSESFVRSFWHFSKLNLLLVFLQRLISIGAFWLITDVFPPRCCSTSLDIYVHTQLRLDFPHKKKTLSEKQTVRERHTHILLFRYTDLEADSLCSSLGPWPKRFCYQPFIHK